LVSDQQLSEASIILFWDHFVTLLTPC